MRRSRLTVHTAALLLAALTAAPALAAWTHDPVNGGVPVSAAVNSVYYPVILADGSGGAFLAWSDHRSNYDQVYVQHLNAYGVAQWTSNGVACASLFGVTQANPAIESDGAGGVVVAWQDSRSGNNDIYAQRVTAAGTITWGSTGAAVCTAAGEQTVPVAASDELGNTWILWSDTRTDAGDLYCNRMSAAGVPAFSSAVGTAFMVATGTQSNPRVIRDSANGFIAAWQDNRSGNYDIYAARVNASGTFAWTSTGVVVCNATGDQVLPSLVGDGAGGAIFAWQDSRANLNGDIYAQYVYWGGLALWTPNGVLASLGGTGTHASPLAVTDGAGGAIIEWSDIRAGYSGPAMQHVSSTGSVTWTAGGVMIVGGMPSGYTTSTAFTADGAGGAVVAYQDAHSLWGDTWAVRYSATGAATWGGAGVPVNTNPSPDGPRVACGDGRGGAIIAAVDGRHNAATQGGDLLAWHLDSWGIAGAEPAISSVRDVPNDNGGKVKVSWVASPLEADASSPGVTDYLVFRSVPVAAAQQALRAGRVTTSLSEVVSAPANARPLLVRPYAASVYYWELAGNQSAYHLPTYGMVIATTGDSMGIGNPKTAFMIEAHNWNNGEYWTSAPDSGYSTDNVPPIVPAPFAGTYSIGTASLHWGANPETDLANYRLYRGTTPSFAANAGSLVATPADTAFVDNAGAGYYYKLTAVDIHGNESPAASLLPSGTLGVGSPATPRSLALAAPSPNPASGSTRIAFELPRAAHVRLTVFDAGGRRVRTLADGPREAGAQAIAFDLRDDRGHMLGAGLYLVRLEADGASLTRRFAAVR